jgi:hypothetical protein
LIKDVDACVCGYKYLKENKKLTQEQTHPAVSYGLKKKEILHLHHSTKGSLKIAFFRFGDSVKL